MLIGGAGADRLNGNAGNDTYVFGRGSNQDSIIDFDLTSGNFDKIALGDGISATDLAISRDDDNIYIKINGTQDQLAIRWFPHSGYAIERVQFADHSYWDSTTLEQLANGAVSGVLHTLPDPIPDQAVAQGSVFSLQFSTTAFYEVLDSSHGYAYAASLGDGSALPGWLTFDGNSRTFGGTPSSTDVGTIDVNVTAAEKVSGANIGTYTIPDTFRLTVSSTNINHQPVLANPVANQNAVEDGQFNFIIPGGMFIDPDVGDSLSLAATQGDGTALPSWLVFDSATRTFNGTPLNGDVGNLSLKVVATDTSGVSAFDTFNISVTNTNDAPTVFAAIADQAATEDSGFSFTVPADTFADVDVGDSLTNAATGADGSALPGWLSFDAASRTFTGTPVNGDVGTLSVKVVATDTGNASVSDTFDLTVSNTNDAPFVDHAIADQAATEDSAFSFVVPGNAFADVDVGDSLTYSATQANGSALPSWLTFSPTTRAFSGTPLNADVGTVSLKVLATDSTGAFAFDTFDVGVSNTNDAPTLFSAIADQATIEDAAFSFTVPVDTFADVDVGDSLTYAATRADGSALPSWLGFNAATRTFIGTPVNGDVGTVTLKIVSTDGSGATTFDTFNLSVVNTNDAPVANPDAVGVLENATTENLVAALLANDTDVDVSDTKSITAVNTTGTAGAIAFNAGTQTLTYGANGAALDALKAGAIGTDTFSYTVTDGAGASSTATVTMTITGVNDAPTLANAIADQAATQDAAFSFTAPVNTFADVDLGDTLAYAATLDNGAALPAWLSFNATNRTFSGTPSASDIGVYAVKLVATDSGSLSAADNFNITVGTSGGLNLIGTPNPDVLNGGAGNDTLNGLGSADLLNGYGGDDTFIYFSDGHWDGRFVAKNVGSPGNAGTGKTAGIDGKNRSLDVFNGGAGVDVLRGTSGNDAIFLDDSYSAFPGGIRGPRISGIERIEGGDGNDVIDLTSDVYAYGNVTLDGGDGNDVLWASSGDDVLLGGVGNDDLFGGAGQDYLMGGGGNDTLNGDRGNDLLEGDDGNDVLTDSYGNNLFYARDGNDSMTGGAGNEIFMGGKGNDSITTGTGADVIAFNRGDDHDTVAASTGQDNTVSLGGGIRYSDLFLSKQGNSLVLRTAANEDITFKDWYSNTANHSVFNLQVVAEAMSDFAPGGSDTLRDNKIERFDFNQIVQKFDQARAVSASNANHWAVMNSLLDAHLAGSDTEAIGGDLAYRYGLNGSLSGIAINAAQNVLASSQFGSAPQALQSLAGLQDGLVKLG